MPRLYLVRHAEPQITGVLLGRSNPPLSPRGREQARQLTLDVRRIWVSSLTRARETASLLRSDAEIVPVPELDEISYGDWDGKRWDEIGQFDPELARCKLEDWTGVAPPGGESWRDFTARIEVAWARIKDGPYPAAVIAHEGVNAVLASLIDAVDPLTYLQGYLEIHEFELGG